MTFRVLCEANGERQFIGTAFRPAAAVPLALTCNHVIDGFDSLFVAQNDQTTPVKPIERNEKYDIAVLAPTERSLPPSPSFPIETPQKSDALTFGYGSFSERTGELLCADERFLYLTFSVDDGDSGSPVVQGGSVVGMAARSSRWGAWVSLQIGDWVTTRLTNYSDAASLTRLSEWFAREARSKTAAVPLPEAIAALDTVALSDGRLCVRVTN